MLSQIWKLLPKVIEKLIVKFPVPSGAWAKQVWYEGDEDVSFDNIKRALSKDDLCRHFEQTEYDGYGNPKTHNYEKTKRREGSLGLLLAHNMRAKTFALDIDTEEGMKVLEEKILPALKEHKIEYIYEYGGYEGEKAHIWFFCDSDVDVLKAFVEKILRNAGVDWRKLKLELYPTHKKSNVIRLLGGLHLRAGHAHPILFRGKESADPLFVMQAIIDCKPVSDEYMIEVLGEGLDDSVEHDPKGILKNRKSKNLETRTKAKKFIYRPLNLQYEFDGAPDLVETMFSNCPAMHKQLLKIEQQSTLNQPGNHRIGLFFANVFGHAIKIAKTEYDKQEAIEARQRFVDEYRINDWSSHNWFNDPPQGWYTPRCGTWEDEFNDCGGCPHRGRKDFQNPSQLFYNEQLRMKRIKKLSMDTAENISKNVWRIANKKIHRSIDYDEDLNLFIKSPQQTYKTTNICKTAVQLAREGHNVLILVPTGKIAIEIYKRLDSQGEDSFLVMSHKNLFTRYAKAKGLIFECPSAKQIQDRQELGVSRAVLKRAYCRNCEWKDECPFPNQYKNAVESDKKIVIAQHAHAKARMAMKTLLEKDFDIMFVDETFINSMFHHVKVTAGELEIYKEYSQYFKWLKRLTFWLRGGSVPGGLIAASEEEKKKLKRKLEFHELPWNLLHYIDAYNQGEVYEKGIGILVFYPWPSLPRKLFTDATAPVKLAAELLDLRPDEIEVIGQKKLVNTRHYNPKNKAIKVIDATNSVSSMSNEFRLEKILRFIGYKAKTEFKGMKSLVTVYKSDIKKVKQFFREYFPKEYKNIIVAGMSIGTNKWRDVNVQYILAGMHFNTLTLKKEAWKYKQGVNYWRAMHAKDEIENQYPVGIKPSDPNWKTEKAVRVNLIIDGELWLVEFDQFKAIVPKETYEAQAEMIAEGISQQADRVRTFDDNLKRKYYWSGRETPGLAFDAVVLESELFAEAMLG